MKKLLILLLVLGLASAASAVVSVDADIEDLTIGALSGQGGGTGWGGNWSGSGSFSVVAETGNQYISNAYAGTKAINRNVSFSDDVYSVQFNVRMGSRQNTWGTNTPGEIQLRESGGGTDDPVHVKFEPASETIRLGNVWLTNYGAIANAGDASPTALKDLYAGWVTIRVDMDEVAGTAKLYWEQNNGAMAFQGNGAMQAGAAGEAMVDLKIQSRAGGTGSEFEIDNFSITPEPATVMLLGLGGLALIRRKR